MLKTMFNLPKISGSRLGGTDLSGKKIVLILTIMLFTASLTYGAALSEGFETWTPSGWTIVQGPCSPTNDITQSGLYAHSDTYSARFSSYDWCTGYDEYLITPQLVTTSGDQTISFWYIRSDDWQTEVFKVGWSSTGTDVSNFTWSAEISDASTTWQQYRKTDLPVGTKYVAIWYYSDYQYYLYVDDVAGPALADMAYSSSTTTQNNTDTVQPGTTDQEIIGIEIVTTGAGNPISVTSFTLNTTGTTSTSDIENAKLWYTGTSSTFATGTQFGSTNATPTGTYSINGTQALSGGTNYFWLTYDIKSTATVNNYVDAECTGLTVGSSRLPTVTAPAGSRQIKKIVIIGTGTYSEYYVPFYGYYDYAWSATIYLNSEIGTSADIKKISYYVDNTPSSYVTNNQKIYMCHTGAVTFADSSKPDPSSMTLVYDASITWNGTGWHEITLSTTFSYDNSQNLLIYYENRDGSYASGYPEWRYTSTSPNCRAKYKYQDTTFPTTSGYRTYSRPNIRIEYDPVSAMAYSSSTVTQDNTDNVMVGTNDAEIVGIQIVTTGVSSPLSITQFNLNTTGCSNPSTDITNAKLWYTGSSSTFATGTQFGSTYNSPDGIFNISGSQELSSGTNYFWLTYNIKSGATANNVVDAQCTQLTDNAKATHVPTETSPTGSRTIKQQPLSGNYNVGAGQDYTKIADAISALNSNGVSGACTFYLPSRCNLCRIPYNNQFYYRRFCYQYNYI